MKSAFSRRYRRSTSSREGRMSKKMRNTIILSFIYWASCNTGGNKKRLNWAPEERNRKPTQQNMPNTYTQIYIQIVFAVKGRQNFIKEPFREDVQKYMAGIINNKKQRLYAIYCMPDHVHRQLRTLQRQFRMLQSLQQIMPQQTR